MTLTTNLDSATGTNWVPFAIFWMLVLLLAVVSASLLMGNNPTCVSHPDCYGFGACSADAAVVGLHKELLRKRFPTRLHVSPGELQARLAPV
jgi:hypothetical protein